MCVCVYVSCVVLCVVCCVCCVCERERERVEVLVKLFDSKTHKTNNEPHMTRVSDEQPCI